MSLNLKAKLISFLMLALVLALPMVSSAANIDSTYFLSITTAIASVVDALIPILIGILVIVFAWGIVKYILGTADSKDSAKRIMIWGVIGITLVVSIWGVVNLLQNVFGITDTSVDIPTVPRPQLISDAVAR